MPFAVPRISNRVSASASNGPSRAATPCGSDRTTPRSRRVEEQRYRAVYRRFDRAQSAAGEPCLPAGSPSLVGPAHVQIGQVRLPRRTSLLRPASSRSSSRCRPTSDPARRRCRGGVCPWLRGAVWPADTLDVMDGDRLAGRRIVYLGIGRNRPGRTHADDIVVRGGSDGADLLGQALTSLRIRCPCGPRHEGSCRCHRSRAATGEAGPSTRHTPSGTANTATSAVTAAIDAYSSAAGPR